MRLSHFQAEIGSLELLLDLTIFETGKAKVVAAVYGPCVVYSNRSSLSPEVTKAYKWKNLKTTTTLRSISLKENI
uniref:Uncharacterized protein n=1 Tax=Tanacetum cinerariifolium TaxID=118510 RepID=A0A6L2L077_TANCI|nr:hypothetical protein [Tanacetum cinerariifolium]